MKKLGGMLSLLLGAVLTAIGIGTESTETIVVGVLLLVVSAIVLTLKITRRNQGDQPG